MSEEQSQPADYLGKLEQFKLKEAGLDRVIPFERVLEKLVKMIKDGNLTHNSLRELKRTHSEDYALLLKHIKEVEKIN